MLLPADMVWAPRDDLAGFPGAILAEAERTGDVTSGTLACLAAGEPVHAARFWRGQLKGYRDPGDVRDRARVGPAPPDQIGVLAHQGLWLKPEALASDPLSEQVADSYHVVHAAVERSTGA